MFPSTILNNLNSGLVFLQRSTKAVDKFVNKVLKRL